ncbi:hypothetical protein Tco_0812908 [Tanacetum coccineum]
MARVSNWNTIVQRFSSKLSQWNARLLSVGGRLSLIKSVLGNLPTYYMSIYMMPVSIQKELESMRNKFFISGDEEEKKITWVKWKKCLASKKLGGLGVGSIFALNIGLLFKWIWRFLCHPNDLWDRLIKILFGSNRGINDESAYYSSYSSWSAILSSVKRIKKKCMDLISFCNRKLGNGTSTRFWDDIWCGESTLKSKFPRVYMLDNDRDCIVANWMHFVDWSSGSVALLDKPNSWSWSLDISAGFFVSFVRSFIDANTLDVDTTASR